MATGQPVVWALVIYAGAATIALAGYLLAQHVRHVRLRSGREDQATATPEGAACPGRHRARLHVDLHLRDQSGTPLTPRG